MIRFQPIPTAPIQPPRRETCLASRMAEDMRELAFAGQNVSIETLAGRGWSAAVVKRIGQKAATIARRRSTRQIAEA